MLDLLLNTVTIIALTIGSFTDIRVREVPDWLSFSLIAAGIGTRLIYAAVTQSWLPFLHGVAGFLIFFLISLIMFYTKQWGGGDAKILMGIGAVMGFDFTVQTNLLLFIINLFFIGAVYGFLISLGMALRDWKKCTKEFKKQMKNKKIQMTGRILAIALAVAALSFVIVPNLLAWLSVLGFIITAILTLYLLIFVKAVEKASFIKWVTPKNLTVGDWVAKEVKHNNTVLASPKDLGLEEHQIKAILKYHKQNKIKRVMIKIGIPFIPSFLIAYLITIFLGNLFLA